MFPYIFCCLLSLKVILLFFCSSLLLIWIWSSGMLPISNQTNKFILLSVLCCSGQFRHLGVTFGAFWMHFSHQKTDWGAKGAQRGATPVSGSPFWAPFWAEIPDFSCIFTEKSCVLHMLGFSMNFGLHWALFGIGSHAIRPRICSPNTLFSFCIFS